MVQNIIAISIVTGTIVCLVGRVLLRKKGEKSSPCDGCAGCDLRDLKQKCQ